ncbi:hypothetical protein LXL04_025132 [Taraxacum kok-saghyz]
MHMPVVFFYPNYKKGDTNILKQSLSKSLTTTQFYPFAGRLSAPPATYINCNDKGVDFLEASNDGFLDDFVQKNKQDKTIDQLFPYGLSCSARASSPKLLEVQLNHFSGGGAAVALSISHKFVDAGAVINFVNYWSTVTRGGTPKNPCFIASSTSNNISVPKFDVTDHKDKVNYGTSIFVFRNSKINDRAQEQDLISTTRVEALTALIFKHAVKAAITNSGSSDPSNLSVAVSLRKKLAEKSPELAVGNFFTLSISKMQGEIRLNELVAEVKKGKMELEGIRDQQEVVEKLLNTFSTLRGDVYYTSSVCNAPFYEVDFGWGKPLEVTVRIPDVEEKTIIMFDTPSGDGISALVHLPEEDISILKKDKEFLTYVENLHIHVCICISHSIFSVIDNDRDESSKNLEGLGNFTQSYQETIRLKGVGRERIKEKNFRILNIEKESLNGFNVRNLIFANGLNAPLEFTACVLCHHSVEFASDGVAAGQKPTIPSGLRPSSPTPPHIKTHNITLLDQFAPDMHSAIVFFYRNYKNGDTNILKKSLSQSLVKLCPIAGRLQTPPAPYINCNDKEVEFLEASNDGQLDDFIHINVQDKTMDQLFPHGLSNTARYSCPKLLEVQLNHFTGGGAAVALSVSHKLADGATIANFMNHWSTITRGGHQKTHGSFHPPIKFEIKNKNKVKYVTRRFVFPNSKISELRNKVNAMGTSPSNPSRVEVLTSLLFKHVVSAASTNSGSLKPSNLSVAVNLRNKFVEKDPDTVVGNLFTLAIAKMVDSSELRLSEVISKARKAKMEFEGLKDEEEVVEQLLKTYSTIEGGVYYSSSQCWLPYYDVDFGWGKPVEVTHVEENTLMLLDTPSGDGITHLSLVHIPEEEMTVLLKDKEFLSYVVDT